MPAAQGGVNSLLRATWTIRFGLSQGRGSPQQHARTGGIKLSLTCELYYLTSGLGQLTAACPHMGGVKFSPTCKVNYQVRTKSGEVFGQLTAACPHRGCQIISYVWIELNYQVRTKSGEVIGHNSDSSQQHARTGGVKLSVTCELDYLRFGL